MATRSRFLAWELPQTEEPGGLQSMGSQSQTPPSGHTHAEGVCFFSVLQVNSLRFRRGGGLADVTQLVQGQGHRFQSSEASCLPPLHWPAASPAWVGLLISITSSP